jgi:two-component system chemotaxis response regulator CheY
MDLLPILSNQRIQNTICGKIADLITPALKLNSSAAKIEIIKVKSETLIMGITFLRFNFLKGSQPVVLGTSDKSTYEKIRSYEKLKELSELLSICLNESIHSEIATLVPANELKKTFIGNDDYVGMFKKNESYHYLQMTFGEESNPIILNIPINSNTYSSNYIYEVTGLIEQSKILIVEDSKMIRAALKNYLNAIGLNNIDEAIDGSEGATKALTSLKKYNLIIADWHMPEMSGLELLRQVRHNADIKTTPFILATSEQKKEEIVEAVKLRVSGYLIKPFTLDMLVKSIKNATKDA